MQVVPEWYLNLMKADSRNIEWHITLCDKDSFTGWPITPDDIESCDVVLELQDVGVPCAYIGQNIATIKVYNDEGRFTTNRTVEVDKYLRRGTKVIIKNPIYNIDNSKEEPYVFTGFVDTIEMDDDNQFCTITAYDALHFIKQQKAPWFRPTGYYDGMKMNLHDFMEYLFLLCNCVPVDAYDEECTGIGFNIDPNLLYTPVYDYLEGDTVGDVLSMLAKLGLCAIYCNALGIICVRMLPKTRSVVYTFDDMSQIISSSTAQLGYSDYTHVSVAVHDAWNSTNLRERLHTSYSTTDKVISVGRSSMNNLSLSSSRVPTSIRIITNERVSVSGKTDGNIAVLGFMQYIDGYDYALNKINLNIYSTKGMLVDISVASYDIWETVNTEVEAVSPNYEDSFFLMKKVLDINVPLITDEAYAQQIANTFSRMLLDTRDMVSCSVRGEPAIELLDCVVITNPRAAQDAVQVLPTRISYSYDGSLSCDIEAIKYSAVAMVTYAFLMPGMYIPYDTGATYIQTKAYPAEAGITEGAGAYSVGDRVVLSCMPFSGYKVSHWIDSAGKNVGTGDRVVVYVSYATTYTAILVEDEVFTTFTLDVMDEANTTVALPPMSLTAASGTIDWGDGTTDVYDATDEAEHSYEGTGTWPITLRAPIENFAYEIFANNSQINTFTAGSHMLYLPNGMFYNSSVRNVNLLPAKNIQYIGTNTVNANTSLNTKTWKSNDSTTPTVMIAVNSPSTSHVDVPKFYNGRLVVGVNVYGGPSNYTADFKDASILSDVDIWYTNFGNVINLKQVGSTSMLSPVYLNYMNSLTIPYGVRTFTPVTFSSNSGPFDRSPYITAITLPSTMNYIDFTGVISNSNLNDIYVDANTKMLNINMQYSNRTINVHKAESTEVLVTGYTQQIVLINDGGVNYV